MGIGINIDVDSTQQVNQKRLGLVIRAVKYGGVIISIYNIYLLRAHGYANPLLKHNFLFPVGNQGKLWRKAQVTLPNYSRNVMLKATRGLID